MKVLKTIYPETNKCLFINPAETGKPVFPKINISENKASILNFKARIEAEDYEQCDAVMAVTMNGSLVKEEFGRELRLLNKPPLLTFKKECREWYDPVKDSWVCMFSPNFAAKGPIKTKDYIFRFDVSDMIRSDFYNILEIIHTKKFLANVMNTQARLVVSGLKLQIVDQKDIQKIRLGITPDTVTKKVPVRNKIPANDGPVEEAYYSIRHGKKREHKPQILFDNLNNWELIGYNGIQVTANLSKEKKLFMESTAKINYRATGHGQYFELRAKKPIPLNHRFDIVDMWVHEDCGYWRRETYSEQFYLIFKDCHAYTYYFNMGKTFAQYWFLRHTVFRKGIGNIYSPDGGTFPEVPLKLTGILVGPCLNSNKRSIYLDSLAFYVEKRKPQPMFKPVDLQSKEIINKSTLPASELSYKQTVKKGKDSFVFISERKNDKIIYEYKPGTGTLTDITAKINDKKCFHPMYGGGFIFEVNGLKLQPGDTNVKARLIDIRLKGKKVHTKWEFNFFNKSCIATYVFYLKNRTLVIEVKCADGDVAELVWGVVAGLKNPQTIFIPHLAYNQEEARTVEPVCAEGVFILGLMDCYRSDATLFKSKPKVYSDGTASYNTGSEYMKLTNGRRRPVKERMGLTISPNIEEVLPDIPNPVSPNRNRLAKYMYSVDVDRRLALRPQMFRLLETYELGPLIDMMHAPLLWRRGGEGFNMRTEPRPEISDQRFRGYTDFLHSKGHLAGMLTEYRDYDPGSIYFRSDYVCLEPDGSWKLAWPGTYHAKLNPGRRIAAKVAKELKKKYSTDIVYFDTHTNIGFFARDFETEVRGAGMARPRIIENTQLIRECRSVHGALTSEGMFRWLQAGHTDMDFAYFLHPFSHKIPLMPVFDLLKIHPRQHGVAALTLTNAVLGKEVCWPQPKDSHRFEQYLANIIAYGNMGNICGWLSWRLDGLIKFWSMLFELQQEYLTDTVTEIKWHNGQKWLNTSEAIICGAYKKGRFYVRYTKGLEIWVHYHTVDKNGEVNTGKTWEIDVDGNKYKLPVYGWLARKSGKGNRPQLLEYHSLVNGTRVDYVEGPNIIYADSRGKKCEFPALSLKGAVLIKRNGVKGLAIVPCGNLGKFGWKKNDNHPWDDDDILKMKPAVNRGCGKISIRLDHLFNKIPDKIKLMAVTGNNQKNFPHQIKDGLISFQPDTNTQKYVVEH